MKFTVENFPEIDIEETKRAVHEYMTRYVINALKTWVISTTDIMPVWSGAAKASFIRAANIAETAFSIVPVHFPDRIELGIAESTTDVFVTGDGVYGWDWSSTLAHISIVEDRVNFIEVGQRAIDSLPPIQLPPLVLK